LILGSNWRKNVPEEDVIGDRGGDISDPVPTAQTRTGADWRIRFLSEKGACRTAYLDFVLAAFEGGQQPRLSTPPVPYPLESGVNVHHYFEALE
jgi:hypothetical protein